MIINFVKILFRNLWRNKPFSVISLGGLSIGMAAVIVIALFLRTEHSFDTFHTNADRIYRVTTSVRSASTGEIRHFATTSPAVARSLVNEFPEVQAAIRMRRSDNHIIRYNDKRFTENKVLYVDSSFFRIFSFSLKRGVAATALQAPNSVVLSDEIAKKYFGEDDPIGKTIMDDSVSWSVTGVLDPVPVNSHIQPEFLVSFATWKIPVGFTVNLDSWTWVTFPTYILLDKTTDALSIQSRLQQFIGKYGGADIASRRTLVLQPLSDIYFSNQLLENAGFINGDRKQSKILFCVAILILIIGGFNFMTLFTAGSIKRTKEVGIRKVMGASRRNLILQIMGEALLLTLFCVPVSIFLAYVSVDYISGIIGLKVSFAFAELPLVIGIAVLMAIAVGLTAAVYPALQLTAFNPAATLRSLFRIPSGVSFKKALVVTQFTISGMLIISSVVMYKQSEFIANKELGFSSSDLIRIEMPGAELQQRFNHIKASLLQDPGVVSVTKGSNIFRESIGSVPIYPDATTDRNAAVQMNIQAVHDDFFETFGIFLKSGRFVSSRFPSDSVDAIVINEAAVKAFGWTGDPVGRRLQIGEIKPGTIVGVVKDFHFRSLHNTIGPLVMYIPPTRMDNIFIKTEPGRLEATARNIENHWKTLAGDTPLNLSYADENIERLYARDNKFLLLILSFCGLSVFVACMGLYGLTMLITHQRTKEIGIRKVLGAGIGSIAALVSREFLVLVAIAILVAAPIALYFLNQWLGEFAYRIYIRWWLVATAAALIMLVAFVTVSFEAFRAAIANPIKSLRNE
ncbi:MAG: ABC transporter permease [Chitinophagaceae bacterium]|nr:ABC transporter permease [Chitinophagaceae bacterium]